MVNEKYNVVELSYAITSHLSQWEVDPEVEKRLSENDWNIGYSQLIYRGNRENCSNARIHMHYYNERANTYKLNVSPMWPIAKVNGYGATVPDHGTYVKEINVSMKKKPERIAKDIETRLIEDYLKHYAVCKERCDRTDQYELDKITLMRQLVREFGDESDNEHLINSISRDKLYHHFMFHLDVPEKNGLIGESAVEIRQSTDKCVDIRIHGRKELVIDLLKWIQIKARTYKNIQNHKKETPQDENRDNA